MPLDRRDFLRAGLTASALAGMPRWLRALEGHGVMPPAGVSPVTDPAVRELALRALDAARAAGAAYADVRLTHTRELVFGQGDGERGGGEIAWLDVGVRVLVDGSWGFAAGARWTPDEMARLGREAVRQAKATVSAGRGGVELGPIPSTEDGDWTMPVDRDPFEVPVGEILDFRASLDSYADWKTRGSLVPMDLTFHRQDKAFAASEGGYRTQRLYRTMGTFVVSLKGTTIALRSPVIAGAGRGWEYVRQAPLREEIDRCVAELEADLALPAKPVDVGRYDVVFDAESMAVLLDGTLGAATELDRALGYDAGSGGSSYLNDPFAMLGQYQAGASLLTVLGDRSAPGGLATVKWDDEGVEPDRVALVENGVLADFSTDREAAGWLRAEAPRQGGARSHGCAAAPRAFDAPLIHPPNLTLSPGTEELDFEHLVQGVGKGIAVKQLGLGMDWHCLNGVGQGRINGVYEVRGGRRVARIEGAAFLLRAPELWRGIQALGGPASRRPFALRRRKGEPVQESWHTVTAVPGVARQVTTIEGWRRQ